jgi:GTP-binding protein
MLPVIAIVGRPNVGKSTLFNRLTKSRDALVADLPGLTRDRHYGEGKIQGQRFIVVDTGGIGEEQQGLAGLMLEQTRQAISEADVVLFMVDGRVGRTAADDALANQLRLAQKPIYFVVNKTEGIDPSIALAEFQALGLRTPLPISAQHGEGVPQLIHKLLARLTERSHTTPTAVQPQGVKVAIIGRPNVGKSTLVNRIIGEERVIVYDEGGTTRDSIFLPFEREQQRYTLIDTAGVRRRSRIKEKTEKFSVLKTLQAIEEANVVLYLVDARDNIVDHDLRLLGFVLDAGKALVIAINKWDGLAVEQKQKIKKELNRRLAFVDFAPIHHISALHGTGVGELFTSIDTAFQAATRKIHTRLVNHTLQRAVHKMQPPVQNGKRIKLRYAHLGGKNPPFIIIHSNDVHIPANYQRFLARFFQKELNLVGTPVRLKFKVGDNPYAPQTSKRSSKQSWGGKKPPKPPRSFSQS